MYCPVCRSEYPADWKRCPKDEAALLRGPTIGKYRIDEVIGAGGMGAVYRAFNPDTHSAVAIKLLHAQAATNDAARARFQREAAAVAALRTRHVITIYDFGAEVDGTLYLVMELLVGHTLRAEIRRPPDLLPMPRLHMIVDGALRGLGAAHRAGVTHRDLKPENVFVASTDDGEVAKILDFGIARVSTKDAQLTQSGALMGTPAYMAPEQVAGNRGQVGPWTDVYSMGVILYEVLTGVSPFGADTITEVLGRVLGRQFVPLRQLRPDLPPAVYDVVDRAMADAHEARYPHADALREAWLAANGGIAPNPTEPNGKPRTAGHDAALTGAPTVSHTPLGSAPTYTPGPVVITGTHDGPRKSRTALWVSLGILVAGGTAAAVIIATGGGKARAIDAGAAVVAPGAPDAAAIAQAGPLDASAAAPTPDAAIAAPPTPPPATDDMAHFAAGVVTVGTAPGGAGGADADPQHDVSLGAFAIDKHEVTLGAMRAALGQPDAGGLAGDHPDWPARYVTAAMAEAACKAMGKRLPREAEWERAAQGTPADATGAHLLEPGHDAPDAVGTHPGDCTGDGVCDLIGNVMEWTGDAWTRPKPRAGRRVVRGASYRVSPTETFYGSAHARSAADPTKPDPELGFRCAKDDP